MYRYVEQLRREYIAECAEGELYTVAGERRRKKWSYVQACLLKSYWECPDPETGPAFREFVKSYIDSLYDSNGEVPELDYSYYSTDQVRMATLLFPLHRLEAVPKYKKTLDRFHEQLKAYPRTGSGNFWHKVNYPNQVWLDGLYMVQPFRVAYIKAFLEEKDYSDILMQFANVRRFLFAADSRLYRHAYDESRKMFWCDAATGRSPNVWCRAVGWLAMALVDTLELLRGESADSAALISMLGELMEGMLPRRDSGGMWYQVVGREGNEGNYPESSGTLMLAYAMLKGARLGFLPGDYSTLGKASFDGTVSRYLAEEGGKACLGGICVSAGLGRHPDTGVVRDGSYEYYTRGENVGKNNGHGVAALLMAYNEALYLSCATQTSLPKS
jgi:unsaturated rhamnogalacturonyl hydrolase